MLTKQGVLLEFAILVAHYSLLAQQVLLAALNDLTEVVVGLDVLEPLKDFLILLDDLVHVVDSDGVVECRHNFKRPVARVSFVWRFEVPLPLCDQRILTLIAFRGLRRCSSFHNAPCASRQRCKT